MAPRKNLLGPICHQKLEEVYSLHRLGPICSKRRNKRNLQTKMDKAIVRFSVIVINLYFLYTVVCALFGESTPLSDSFFSQSLLGAIILVILAFSQGKYHCKWMQALTLNILFTTSVNIAANYLGLFQDIMVHIIVVSLSWSVSTILAFYFAISHFIKVKRIKRLKNG